MADKKPFHQSVVDRLKKLNSADEWERACALLDLMAETTVPVGEGVNIVDAAIDSAICFADNNNVNRSVVKVIIAHDGRLILKQQLNSADPDTDEGDIIYSLVSKFNEQKGIEPIEISEDDEDGGGGDADLNQAEASLDATERGEESAVPVGEALKALGGDANNQSLDFLAKGGMI